MAGKNRSNGNFMAPSAEEVQLSGREKDQSCTISNAALSYLVEDDWRFNCVSPPCCFLTALL